MVSYDISLEFDSKEKAESFFKALQKLGTIQKERVVSKKTFTEKQLVEFGNYLLSDERKKLYASHPHFGDSNLEERLSMVNDADISNYLDTILKRMNSIPNDAKDLECFAIKNNGAFIGFKSDNGNFNFIQIPYTEKTYPVKDDSLSFLETDEYKRKKAEAESLLNSDHEVQESDTSKADSSNDDYQIKIAELREKFFKDWRFADTHPKNLENLFEWFKPYLKIPSIDWEGLEKAINQAPDWFKHAQGEYYEDNQSVFDWLKTNLPNYIK